MGFNHATEDGRKGVRTRILHNHSGIVVVDHTGRYADTWESELGVSPRLRSKIVHIYTSRHGQHRIRSHCPRERRRNMP